MNSSAQNSSSASGAVAIKDPTGLHARPAVKLTKLAKSHDATVEIRAGAEGKWVNAKSPNAVMKLKVGHGEVLHIRAEGAQAGEAVGALVDLIERDFDGKAQVDGDPVDEVPARIEIEVKEASLRVLVPRGESV